MAATAPRKRTARKGRTAPSVFDDPAFRRHLATAFTPWRCVECFNSDCQCAACDCEWCAAHPDCACHAQV